ncbi:MAG TPA: DUF6629 family protein [Bacteroidia bacterium]|jgi:hypothetical protein|nr:DUF6629 family protein [Bacteroidia bacterium]
MCFSATASFGASAVLAVISVASLKQVRHKSQIMFACIPIFFSLQQFTEGIVWLSFAAPFNATLNVYGTYAFLIFAQVVWPLWIPIAMVRVENKGERRKIQRVFVAIGVTEAIYQAFCLFNYPVISEITAHHIYYHIDHPDTFKYIDKYIEPVFYASATIVSPFFTSVKKMWIVALAILISCVITVVFFQHVSVSVWCFFASIISISVYLIMRELRISYKLMKQ